MREKIFEEHHNINLRFTAKQHDWLGREAARRRISRAELVRKMVDAEIEVERVCL